jgi:dihydropteroate synthase
MELALSQPAEGCSRPDTDFLFRQGRVWIMGVLNATPDSFYAGARANSVAEGLARAQAMIDSGAALLDIGGESTRPGALPVSTQQELERVFPLVQELRARWPGLPISIDTRKAEVARQVLTAGGAMVNDVSALRADPTMAALIAEARCPVVLMHMKGTPETMQDHPHYEDVVSELKAFFEERLRYAVQQGISERQVILDPGIGFGKRLVDNLMILKHLSELADFGRPLLVGVSRKSFIGQLGRWRHKEPLPPEDRLEGSLAAALWAVDQGAQGLRVHDVEATRRALAVHEALKNHTWPS